ncbi:LysM peptidoglycan-binding domain-containing protein [Hydrogenimonas sp. SS33]|uniref:lytic transglycosylase domain-containing protein n=1 Tax=Hydrogenimonas leucolamina TaxID=2954236 RepID=UPI00336BDAE1
MSAFLIAGTLHASLMTDPVYIDDAKVLETLDIPSGFLRDPLFRRFKNDLTTRKRNYYLRMLRRGQSYIPTLRKMLAKEDVPQVFLYMAMAESHFDAHARSSAKAVGLWQFMPKTARLYGLKIDRYVDERKDPVRSTEAAIAYLKRLYGMFGKWYLAALAYNCGEGRVLQAIKKAGSDDLHTLLDEKKRYLPRESRNYLRKILSLALVANNAQLSFTKAELKLFNPSDSERLVRVRVNGGESMEHIARQIGMSTKALKELNPQFKYGFTPPQKSSFINIPLSKVRIFRTSYKPGRQKSMYLVHRVKKGETLSQIAYRYGIHYKVIASFNKIRRGIIYPKQELVIPIPKGSIHRYKVKPGDSIYKIARRFGVKVATIKTRNALKSDIIHVGDRLVIPN